jgi:REP element-mobilizing transposase RayT
MRWYRYISISSGEHGIADHLHLLVCFPSTITVADFIKGVKGSTSHLMTHKINSDEFFKWQGSYAAYSVSEYDISRIKSYIQNQIEHHYKNQVDNVLEL